MHLGAFSVSLSVKDIHASIAFYEALGFSTEMDPSEGWVIMQQGTTVIGLFQGMFEGNMLTFNPGWDQAATPNGGPDIRSIQTHLQEAGIEIPAPVDPASEGPAHFTLTDPDGNTILLDQYV